MKLLGIFLLPFLIVPKIVQQNSASTYRTESEQSWSVVWVLSCTDMMKLIGGFQKCLLMSLKTSQIEAVHLN